jgi:type I restriction enzyme, S subunit
MNNYQLSVKKYPLYKDSAIAWLGDVPEHWEIKKLKDIISVKSGDSIKLIDTLDIDFIGENFPVFGGNGIIGYTDKYNCSGDTLVVGRVGAKCGNVRYVNEKLWVSDNALIVKSKIDNQYLEFFINTLNLNRLASANAQPLITSSLVKNEFIAIPTANEIKVIALYLDTKTAQCDRKIDLLTQKATQYGKLKQSLINETLTRGLDKSMPMKDSGVEWIGEIPNHWEVVRNKQIFQERSILSSTGKETLLTVSHITGVTPRSEKNVNMFMAETMEGYKICRQGDLIINTMWAWMGALGTSNYFGICSPAYNVYMPVNNVPYDYRYFDYLYRTPSAIVEMTRNSKGIVSSRLRLYAKEFFQIKTPLPPLSEQKAIADYLDTKTTQIDQIIQTINTQIEKLKELRKTLINDVVTGKIRV